MHTTTELQRVTQKFYQIPDEVFETGKFEKNFDRGIKLAKVR
jgi:hypothetical protein